MPPRPIEIQPLTSLRFFAAALVVLEHLQMIPGLEWMGTDAGVLGKSGVTIFFVLSGFILAHSYGDRDWQNAFRRNARDFFWGRFARIYPLHWLMFLVALPLGLNSLTARVSLSDFPWLLTLTDKLWPGYVAGPQPDKVAWTLSCEALFYLLTPGIFFFLSKRASPLRASVWFLTGYTSLVIPSAIYFPDLNWQAYLRVPEFLLGIAGFHFARKRWGIGFGVRLLALGVLAMATVAGFDSCLRWRFYYLAYAPGALLIILGCANISGSIESFLCKPLLVLLGHASYALYLFHDPLLRYSRAFFIRYEISFQFPWTIPAAVLLFGCASMGSILCFRWYESPLRKRLRLWLARGQTGFTS